MQIKPDPIPMTAAGYQRMKCELKETLAYREEVLIRLQAAREMGDLSENGAYTAARHELGTTDRKLRRLKLLDLFGIIQDPVGVERVGFGNAVTLKNKAGLRTFTVVTEYESDPKLNRISMKSPLGQAVMGKKKGDTVTLLLPGGEQHYLIVDIK